MFMHMSAMLYLSSTWLVFLDTVEEFLYEGGYKILQKPVHKIQQNPTYLHNFQPHYTARAVNSHIKSPVKYPEWHSL